MLQAGNFLHLWFNNIFTIIDVLIIASFILIFLIALFSFRETKKLETGESLNELENTLRRVLESTEVKASSVNVSSAGEGRVSRSVAVEGTGSSEEVNQQLKGLKEELEAKQLEVVGLRDKLDSLESSGGVSSETEAKLKELEAKLQEYEIIEDDIANLSLYKQENSKLKEEIEKLKAGLGGEASVASSEEEPKPAAAVEKAPETPTTESAEEPEDDIMAEFAAAVNEQKSGESPKEAPIAEEASTAEADDDIMAEFAAAVNEQKSGGASKEEAASAADAEESDDVMAEFAAAVNEQKAEESSEKSPEPAGQEDSEDDVMAEFAAAVNEQKNAESGDEVSSATEAAESQIEEKEEVSSSEVSGEDDIMAEFAAAVDQQEQAENSAEPVSSQEDIPSVEESKTDASEPAATEKEDDVMAEFAAAVAEGDQASSELSGEPVEEEEEEELGFEAASQDEGSTDIMGEFSSEDLILGGAASNSKETPSASDSKDEIDLASLIDPEDIHEDPNEGEEEESPEEKKINDPLNGEQAQLVAELTAEGGALDQAVVDHAAEGLIDENTFEQFNQVVQEQREARKIKEEEIAAKVAELGIGVDVKETVTDQDMQNFRDALAGAKLGGSDGEEAESFLEGQMDTDKILSEVHDLENVAASAEEGTEEDPGAQLIAEFESFAQKN